jgi:hypothetical protein
VSVGIVLASVLGIREVITEPVIQLGDVRGSEEGVVPVQAQVLAQRRATRPTASRSRSPPPTETVSVRHQVAADDRRRHARARSQRLQRPVRDLTQQEIDEKLDSYYAFVTRQEPC